MFLVILAEISFVFSIFADGLYSQTAVVAVRRALS